MADSDKPNKVKLLADALAQARRSEAPHKSTSDRPARGSVPPPPQHDRHRIPHRERHHGAPRQSLSGELRQSRPVSEPPQRLYVSEVKRASLLPDDFDDLPPHMQAMLSAPPPTTSSIGIGRTSLNPGLPERPSVPPSQFEDAPSTARRSLNPLASLKSLLPGQGPSDERHEDPRFHNALLLRRQNRKLEAMLALEELRRAKPEYPQARELLFTLAVELGAEDRVRQHADWMIAQQNLEQDLKALCSTYRAIRMACPNLGLSEKALIAVLVAADKIRDGRAAVDVTKLLLRDYPQSSLLPRAFMSSAQVQVAEGRPDLAKATLQNLIARFPHDTLAVYARKKLNELG